DPRCPRGGGDGEGAVAAAEVHDVGANVEGEPAQDVARIEESFPGRSRRHPAVTHLHGRAGDPQRFRVSTPPSPATRRMSAPRRAKRPTSTTPTRSPIWASSAAGSVILRL